MSRAAVDAARCLSLVALAHARPGSTPRELARLSGLPVKRVLRDLFGPALLCGVPPYLPHQFVSCALIDGRVRVAFADHLARPLALTPLEAMALRAAAVEASGADDPAVRGLVEKLALTMPDAERRAWERLAAAHFTADGPAAAAAEATLRRAATARRRVVARYRGLGRPAARERTLEPLGVVRRDGAAYLVAVEAGKDGGPRTFRLDRFLAVRETSESFAVPTGFRLKDFASGSRPSRRATVRAGAAFSAALRRTGRKAARAGRGAAAWREAYFDDDAFAEHLLSFGASDFEALEPPSLRRRIADAAAAAAAAHAPQ
jgi:proteasome accessory factor C